MNLKFTSLALCAVLCTGSAFVGSAQDFDDIYYNPKTAPKKEKKQPKPQAVQENIDYNKALDYYYGNDYPAADSYTTTGGRDNVSLDEYNRRGIFATADTVDTAAVNGADNRDFAYTQRIKRFYNSEVANGDDVIAEYLASPRANVNIIVNNPSPYYGGYWGYGPYSPYYSSYYYPYYSSIYYDPFFWGSSWAWGPSWNWGWGPSWNWGWGPSWSWGWGPSWSWGWGPSWGWSWSPTWRPPYNPGHNRPNHGGGVHRPTTGQRPGAVGNRRPTADGYRPGSGVYPGSNSNASGVRPGTGRRPTAGQVNRPGSSGNNSNNNGSYSRPGRGGNDNRGTNYNRSSNGSNYRSSGGSYSGGSRGGSSGGGGGRSGGSRGGRR